MEYNHSLIHNLNLDYKKSDNIDYEKQTDITLNRIMNNFVDKNKDKFKDTAYILEYNDDFISLISYYILKNIQGIYPFKLYLYGETKKTKKLINNKKDILFSKRKLKRIKRKEKNIEYLGSFNPIYYVEKVCRSSNNLEFILTSENYKRIGYDNIREYLNDSSIVKTFTLEQFKILFKFFNIDSYFSSGVLNTKRMIYNSFCKTLDCSKIKTILDEKNYNRLNKEREIVTFKLNGNENDFKIYDEILTADKNNKICQYECDRTKEKDEFIMNNLNYYINSRNAYRPEYNVNIML